MSLIDLTLPDFMSTLFNRPAHGRETILLLIVGCKTVFGLRFFGLQKLQTQAGWILLLALWRKGFGEPDFTRIILIGPVLSKFHPSLDIPIERSMTFLLIFFHLPVFIQTLSNHRAHGV